MERKINWQMRKELKERKKKFDITQEQDSSILKSHTDQDRLLN